MKLRILLLLLLFVVTSAAVAGAQDDDGYAAERQAGMTFALQHLTDRDPLVRQRAAEVLAKFSAVEHLRLTEGYRFQEKNDRVRLALDWALYRMGKNDALYGVVRELRSDSRRGQAVGYLSQLAGPQQLYPFFDRADNKTMIGLLDVMANIGTEDSLELVKSFENSYDPKIAGSAKFASESIARRAASMPSQTTTRPREVTNENDVEPDE